MKLVDFLEAAVVIAVAVMLVCLAVIKARGDLKDYRACRRVGLDGKTFRNSAIFYIACATLLTGATILIMCCKFLWGGL